MKARSPVGDRILQMPDKAQPEHFSAKGSLRPEKCENRHRVPIRSVETIIDRAEVDFAVARSHDGAWEIGDSMLKFGTMAKRLWRPVIGVAVAYAVAMQTLLIVLAGFSSAAQVDLNAPGFALCHHDAQDAPASPSGNPSDTGCSHCIFCFAGSHQGLSASPPVLFHRVNVEIVDALPSPGSRIIFLRSAHSIASPRGPPLPA